MRFCSLLSLVSLLVAGFNFIHPSNVVHAPVEPGVGFGLSLDYRLVHLSTSLSDIIANLVFAVPLVLCS